MLPFLRPKKMSAVIMASAKPEGGMEDKGMEGEPNPGLVSAMEDFISAVHMKDASAAAKAWAAADEISDMDDESPEAGA